MNRILITGASGFVGNHLVDRLLADGEQSVFAAVFGNGGVLKPKLAAKNIISGDLTDPTFTLQLIKEVEPDLIYHLAAHSVVESSIAKAGQILTSNIQLQYNLLEAVRLHAPKCRVLAICSANEYGLVDASDIPITEDTPLRPLNPYAVSKISQDMLAYQYYLAHNLDIVRLRPFNHTGAGQTTDFVIPALTAQFVRIVRGEQSPVIQAGNLDSIRDFTDVEDMVSAYILASTKCKSGEVYNIGYGQGISVRQIITLLSEISGQSIEIVSETAKLRPSDVPVLISDSTQFRRVTGWEPQIALKETLTRVYNYTKGTHDKLT